MLRGIAAYVRRHHIALLALFFALGGTAFAAGNALVPKNSVGTAQLKNGAVVKAKISKKTLAQLKGNRGLRGPAGPQGTAGAQGVQGVQGPEGPFPATLPAGKKVRGSFYILGTATAAGQYGNDSIAYVYPLASAPSTHYIAAGTTPPAQCPGTAANPQAQSGNLCVYEASNSNVTGHTIDPNTLVTNANGAALFASAAAAGNFFTLGTWAVTG